VAVLTELPSTPFLPSRGEPDGPGYAASGRGRQSIIVLPKSRAVIVYLANVQPDSEISETAIKPLNDVLFTAFR
jgi:hypothetical protein